MSSNAIEKALWQAFTNPADGQRLREDAQSYLKDFQIDENERSLVASWDVSGMAARGVNPLLLLMAYTSVNGANVMEQYIQKIHQPPAAGSSK